MTPHPERRWTGEPSLRRMVSILWLLALAGCATKPMDPMSRDQWKQETKRTYTGVTPDQVIKSAERLFKLWDGSDFTFGYADNEITATRKGFVFAIINYTEFADHWRVSAQLKDKDSVEVSVNLAVSGTSSTMALGGATPIMGPGISNGANVNTPYIYRLFWSRMDYLLGKGDRWFSCAEWKDTRGVGIAELGSPCNMLADDKSPVQTATK